MVDLCYGFAVFLTAASIFAQSNEPTPPSGKDFKSVPIVPAKETKPWSINFAPLWRVTAVDGTITLRGITSQVHESAIETLKSLQFAFMAAAEIRYKRWGSWATLSTQRRRASQAHREAFRSQPRPRTWKNLLEPSCSSIDPWRQSGASSTRLPVHGSMPLRAVCICRETFFRTSHHPLRQLGRSHHRDERPNPDFAFVFHQCLWRCASHSDADVAKSVAFLLGPLLLGYVAEGFGIRSRVRLRHAARYQGACTSVPSPRGHEASCEEAYRAPARSAATSRGRPRD